MALARPARAAVNNGQSVAEAATAIGISRATLYRHLGGEDLTSKKGET